MKDVLFGWLTKGKCDVSILDLVIMLVEILAFVVLGGMLNILCRKKTKRKAR